MILITDAGAIVLSIAAVILTGVLIFFLIKGVKKQDAKLREEKSILVDTMMTKSQMREAVNTYATRVGQFGSFTLFYIKIDEFETLKEILGADPVVNIVKDLAERLVRMFKGAANIAQFEDNTFLIFDKKEYNYEDLEDTSERLLELVNDTSNVSRAGGYNVTASIGVAVYPTCGVTFKELFSNLELATYICTRQGGNKYIIYYNELKQEESGNLEYFNEVRDAMNKGELTLFYQPIVSNKTKALWGFEALLRWEHPVHGIIPPSKFIPILEQSGDIKYLAKWSLEKVIHMQQNLLKIYPNRDVKLTINLSVKQMMEEGMADDFKKIIRKYNADPSRIVLEVAQYAMFEKMNAVRVNLLRLRDSGFLISTDGLGLDYAAISQIESKPIDILKLDKAFLDDITDNQMQERYVGMLVDSCEKSKRTIICEGVEDYQKLAYVKKNRIEYAQGYYISKPFPADDVVDYVHNESWKERIDHDILGNDIGDINHKKNRDNEHSKEELNKTSKKIEKNENATNDNKKEEIIVEDVQEINQEDTNSDK